MFRKAAIACMCGALLACAGQPPLRYNKKVPCRGAVCPVDIVADVSDGKCNVTEPDSNDLLDVSSKDSNIRIVWKPTSPQFEFCVEDGDGVWFKNDTNNQFHSGAPTDDEQGQPDKPAKCKRFFVWTDRNTLKDPHIAYQYGIAFRHKNGAKCSVDPWVVNR